MRAVTTGALTQPTELAGAFVRLERLTTQHAEGLAAAAAEDRSSYTYTGVPDGIDAARAYVAGALAEEETRRAVAFAVRRLSDGAVVGATRLLDLSVFTWPPSVQGPPPDEHTPPSVAEIGATWYSASAQRTPVNTECKLLLLTQAFDEWGTVRVTIKTDARNGRSRAAIERIGATFEGVRRAHHRAYDGELRNTAYYSIVADEWPAVRDRLREHLSR
jgi:N-acetyltransferase